MVLGAVVLVLGAGFVILGVNGWMAARPRTVEDRSGEGHSGRPPVPGVGRGTHASSTERRIVATAWLVVGILFIVAAFTHQLP